MIIKGSEIAEKIYEEIGDKLEGKKVCFLIFRDNPETRTFVDKKRKIAEKLGVQADVVERNAKDTREALEIVAEVLAQDYDGVVIQLPLPPSFDPDILFDILPPELDIDVLGEESKYKYESSKSEMIPPVAGAVEEILTRNKIDFEGLPTGQEKKVLVLGRGKLVGEPVSLMLYRHRIIHDIIDINTPEKEKMELLKDADIVISGIGVPHYIKPEMLKKDVVLIDAGTSEQAGKLAGDADPACSEVASVFTPVPGGVGPLTIAVLFRNLLR